MENWSTFFWSSVAISLLLFPVSIGVAWFLVVKMPPDYLTREKPATGNSQPHFAIRIIWIFLRNLFGTVLLIAGLIMLFTPGQGLLFIFLGVAFLDFPGKRRLVYKLLSQPKITQPINRLRARSGKPPLDFPTDTNP